MWQYEASTYPPGAARLVKFSSRLTFDEEGKKENMFSTSSTSSAADAVTI